MGGGNTIEARRVKDTRKPTEVTNLSPLGLIDTELPTRKQAWD